jgi:hypothetical protein
MCSLYHSSSMHYIEAIPWITRPVNWLPRSVSADSHRMGKHGNLTAGKIFQTRYLSAKIHITFPTSSFFNSFSPLFWVVVSDELTKLINFFLTLSAAQALCCLCFLGALSNSWPVLVHWLFDQDFCCHWSSSLFKSVTTQKPRMDNNWQQLLLHTDQSTQLKNCHGYHGYLCPFHSFLFK